MNRLSLNSRHSHGAPADAPAPAECLREKLTVLQVLPALESGGVERGVLEIARGLVKAGHRSLVASAGGRLVNRLIQDGSEHFECHAGDKSLRCLLAIHQLRTIITREQVQVLDVHSRLPAWMVWAALRSLPAESRPRLITTFHGYYSVSRYSRIMGAGDRVICVSEALSKHVQDAYPSIDRSNLRIVPRGICHDEFPRGFHPSHEWCCQFERDFPQARGRKILLLPGRVTRLKGHREFIDLIAALRRIGHDVHGFIVGGVDARKTEYAEELIHHQSQLGLTDHITWTGYRSDVKEFYAVSSLVFSLSRKPEAFGRTIAESLAIGTPVVAWDHGGARETMIRAFPTGLVTAHNTDELLRRVLQLIDRSEGPEVGEVPSTQSDMISGTLSVYSEVVAGAGNVAGEGPSKKSESVNEQLRRAA